LLTASNCDGVSLLDAGMGLASALVRYSFLNGQSPVAAVSGGIATLSTYMAASIWIDSDSPWIAAGAILQGLGTLATLILLVWQIISWQASREEAQLDQLLTT